MRRAFNVNRLYSRYFSDPIAFRCLQSTTGALVSGLTALQLFDRSFYPESDLDIYVPFHGRKQLGHFLLNAGYRFVHNFFQHSNFDDAVSERRVMTATGNYGNFKGISGVFTLEKDRLDGNTLRVQIMVATRSPIEVILRFHSSGFTFVWLANATHNFMIAACVMNIIAFDRAYCLYPRTTLEDRFTLVCTTRDDDVIEGVYKRYERRGWTIICGIYTVPFFTSDPSLHTGTQWINDSLTWLIPLSPPLVDDVVRYNSHIASFARDPVSITGWTLSATGLTQPAAIEFLQFKADHLFHHYVLISTGVVNSPSIFTLLDTSPSLVAMVTTINNRH